MRRFYIFWLIAVTLSAVLAAAIQSTLERSRLADESDKHASAILTTIEDPVRQAYHAKRFSQIAKTVRRLDVAGLAICSNRHGESPRAFPGGSGWQSVCDNPHVKEAQSTSKEVHWNVLSLRRTLRFTARPVGNPRHGRVIVLVQNAWTLHGRWIQEFYRSFLVYWLTGLVLLALIATQVRLWLQKTIGSFRQSIHSLTAGRRPRPLPTNSPIEPELSPITQDLNALANKIRSLSNAKTQTHQEKSWLTELKRQLEFRELLVVANREPYIHQRIDGEVRVVRPASGLVTALEPILRQCGGLWLAHGSGSADRETSDENGIVAVPPTNPKYKLKRVWLSKEEENGYYYGFANEGLWPLCHLAHNRPSFRLSDWEHYQNVNQKFCDSIPETKLDRNTVFLIQDYHFALLPRMIQKRGHPKIGIFWHIPWPNPEAFGICPWGKELLRGMLGADVVGFHTQYHCNNFLETCNRYLEARIDYERFSVTMENHETLVQAFPIGIETSPITSLAVPDIEKLKRSYGIIAEKVAVGVDRLDYTKGLLERVDAVERFLEKYPDWVGRFTLAQMGSPSRTQIPAYQELAAKLQQVVDRVNDRFRTSNPDYRAIALLPTHHDWEEIQLFYQMGDVCMVTSLHDGMNLVAKEYVWCQSPDRGSLILSKFAGASRELTEAFIVNPYSIEEMADALAASLSLSPTERELRMRAMREKVQNRSAFHWASDLIESVIQRDELAAPTPVEADQKDKSQLADVS